MRNPRIVVLGVFAMITIAVLLFQSSLLGYERVGRVNEYYLYYAIEQDQEPDNLYDGYILRQGITDIDVEDAIDQELISQDYIELIDELIRKFEEE